MLSMGACSEAGTLRAVGRKVNGPETEAGGPGERIDPRMMVRFQMGGSVSVPKETSLRLWQSIALIRSVKFSAWRGCLGQVNSSSPVIAASGSEASLADPPNRASRNEARE
jgi:hypothetical protein